MRIICLAGAFAILRILYDVCALRHHPWRSYSVFVRLILVLIGLAGITLPVFLFPVSSFRLSAISAAPIPVVCRCACRRMIVVGSLVVIYRSVGLDLQLETV